LNFNFQNPSRIYTGLKISYQKALAEANQRISKRIRIKYSNIVYKESKYQPLLTSQGFIFQVLAFNIYGATHQHVYNLLSELQNKVKFCFLQLIAFNATNFLSYATKRLSKASAPQRLSSLQGF
jgi:hypothetical protein